MPPPSEYALLLRSKKPEPSEEDQQEREKQADSDQHLEERDDFL
jgi:hypothetical protein